VLKIGDFSKLGQVTVKTLRHYARLGLLKPAWTDRFSGYRYYTLQQLPRLNRILALKDLGFTLGQIAGLVEENVPVEQLRGMLRRKQRELEVRLRVEQNRLGLVAARLQQIEMGEAPASQEVLVKSTPALPVASISAVVPQADQLSGRIARLIDELDAWLARGGICARGPWMLIQPAQEYRERDIPIELAVGLEAGMPGNLVQEADGRVRRRTLPPVAELATLVHTGSLETMGQAYAVLYVWMEANRRRPVGPARELYLRDAHNLPDREDWLAQPVAHSIEQVVEIQIPVEPFAPVQAVDTSDKEPTMQPKIVTLPAFNVVGLCYHGDNANQEISVMWGEFNRRAREIKPYLVPAANAYGVCAMVEGLPEGHFEYVAGFEVREDAPVPEGMVQRRVPAQKYAVFEHVGPLDKLRETYHNVYQVWLPQSGLEVAPGYDMEVYTEEFKDFAPDSVFYIYVPVK
jgi:predicted transcriptional regulator YdeE/DNA-binding transcriptional MerR regulator